MLGTAHSELGSFELGVDAAFEASQSDSVLQPKLDPVYAKPKKLADLDDKDPNVVDPILEEALREKPEQPLVVRGRVVEPEPRVIFVEGKATERVVHIETVVERKVFVSSRRKKKMRKPLTLSKYGTNTVFLQAPPVQQAAIEPQSNWPSTRTWIFIGLAILGGILIGMAIANHNKRERAT